MPDESSLSRPVLGLVVTIYIRLASFLMVLKELLSTRSNYLPPLTVGLVATQEAKVQLPRGRVSGLAVKDRGPAVFPQDDEAVGDFDHSLMDKLQEVLLVLRASRRKRGYPKRGSWGG